MICLRDSPVVFFPGVTRWLTLLMITLFLRRLPRALPSNSSAIPSEYTSALQTGNTSGTGVAAKTLSVTIDGGAAKLVDFTGDTNVGSGETLQQVADYVNTRLNAGYGTNGVVYAAINNGALEIAGQTPGSAVGKVIVGNGGAAALLGLNTTGAAVTVNAKNESVANVVAYLNSAAQKALGTSDAASIFTVDGAGAISIASQTKGAVSKFTMGSNSGAGATIATALGLDSPTTVTSGKNASLSSIASTLTQAFRANDTLNKAALQATQSGSGLNVASSNGTSFRLAEYNTGAVNGGAASTLGFTSNGGPFAMALVSGVSKATMLDAGGTSAIGTGTTDNPYVSFKAMQFGSDAQTLTFTANNTNLGLLMLAWSGVALAVASAARRRSVAGGSTGVLALATFLLDYIGRLWKPAESVAWLSPFRYYSSFDMVTGGRLPLKNVAVLTGIAIAGFIAAQLLFARRDISH